MPEEFSRTTARKTVVLPGGDKVKVPVITKISFIDPFDRHQETEHNIDNSAESNRLVHVDRVHHVDVDADGAPENPTAPAEDTTESLFVERIDTWNVVDPFERHQETQLTLDNSTGNDLLPPHFTNHERTHIYRYHEDPQNPDDDGTWIDSELIDEFAVIDPQDRHQETHYTLTNPTNAEFRDGDLSGQASADDPDITTVVGDSEGEGTEDNPVRLDPFQNIVNYSSGLYVVVVFTWNDWNWSAFPETWFGVGAPTTVWSLYGGAEAEVIPVDGSTAVTDGSEITVDFSETVSPDVTLLNEPIITVESTMLKGYEQFGPCETGTPAFNGPPFIVQPAGCPPPPDPDNVHFFSAGVPRNNFTKTFLFSAKASSAIDPTALDPTEILFAISGVPASGPSTKVIATVAGQDVVVNRQSAAFRFSTYVFSSGDVDVYLADNKFPVRKKDIDPTGPSALGDTLAEYRTETFQSSTGSYIDGALVFHEVLEGIAEIVLLFEKFKLSDNKNDPLAWPEQPNVLVVGPTHFRQYTYRANRSPGSPIVSDVIDFGTSPP